MAILQYKCKEEYLPIVRQNIFKHRKAIKIVFSIDCIGSAN